jgi:hypothetical protein
MSRERTWTRHSPSFGLLATAWARTGRIVRIAEDRPTRPQVLPRFRGLRAGDRIGDAGDTVPAFRLAAIRPGLVTGFLTDGGLSSRYDSRGGVDRDKTWRQ